MLSETAIGKFRANLRGELIQRGDERCEDARKLYNGLFGELVKAHVATSPKYSGTLHYRRE